MASSYGHQIFTVYDVDDETRAYLSEFVEGGFVPRDDLRQVVNESLITGAERWHGIIECAQSLRQRASAGLTELEPRDILAYVPVALESPSRDVPWANTDRLIALAREQATATRPAEAGLQVQNYTQGFTPTDSGIPWARTDALLAQATEQAFAAKACQVTREPRARCQHGSVDKEPEAPKPTSKRQRRKKRGNSSQYWTESHSPPASDSLEAIPTEALRYNRVDDSDLFKLPKSQRWTRDSLNHESPVASHRLRPRLSTSAISPKPAEPVSPLKEPGLIDHERHRDSKQSPYFGFLTPTKEVPKPRPLAGTIASVPFPPLDSPMFGLAQEKYAHEPYWLLIAVTFLIKTRGTVAMPVFRQLKERFPSVDAILDPANMRQIKNLIQPLGLVNNRYNMIQKYSRVWNDTPPEADSRYNVRGYDLRDVDPSVGHCAMTKTSDSESENARVTAKLTDWEIGHMTQGKYALDSWRIFCRDELLGRATDWNGQGAKGEFQPEWMRVRPNDKELRAYLRWMWMREGWEWDPRTGERTVLCDDLRQAVNERRVAYDNCGDLKITDELRDA